MYYSCLFPDKSKEPESFISVMPDHFSDLNLDQITSAAMADYEKYDLARHYYTAIHDTDVISYRQEAMKELEKPGVLDAVKPICEILAAVSRLQPKLESSLNGEGPMENNAMTKGQYLNAAIKYIVALQDYADRADALGLSSKALKGFADYVKELFETPGWKAFLEHAARVRASFDALNYCMLVKDSKIRLRKYEEQEDESEYIRELFSKFAAGETKDYRQKLNENAIAYHVESGLLELLVKMYPDEFKDLTDLTKHFPHFLDGVCERFALEMQFYFSFLDYIAPIRLAGRNFCYPVIAAQGDRVEAVDSFDLALAHSRLSTGMPVVNGFFLEGKERVIVVTGPNQGGKTTFARSIGQMLHLFMTGLCVPGTRAQLPPVSHIFTHFEKEENVENGAGKLMDDLERIKPMLDAADRDSFFIVNEIFASTTLDDATAISRQVMQRLLDTGARAIWVTFIAEMAEYGPEIVSMMSMVDDSGTEKRTFRIERKSADGLAHAMYIAKKHALTYEQLMGRLRV